MKHALLLLMLASFSGACFAAQPSCKSISVHDSGGWKPAASAPRDGTAVEMLETFGSAPWYGLFKWTKDQNGVGSWVNADNPKQGVVEDPCLFWRPYTSTGKPYVEPTEGAAQ
jgi:hypothetical protein